jgi:hypothetical protein
VVAEDEIEQTEEVVEEVYVEEVEEGLYGSKFVLGGGF